MITGNVTFDLYSGNRFDRVFLIYKTKTKKKKNGKILKIRLICFMKVKTIPGHTVQNSSSVSFVFEIIYCNPAVVYLYIR